MSDSDVVEDEAMTCLGEDRPASSSEEDGDVQELSSESSSSEDEDEDEDDEDEDEDEGGKPLNQWSSNLSSPAPLWVLGAPHPTPLSYRH